MKVSIVTTCLNAASTIRETIESVLSQSGNFELEYIVSDAGSTDGTTAILAEYKNRLKFISAPGLNQSQGINLGLAQASGDILAFINADDIYTPNAIASVVEAFDANPNSLWLYGQCRIIDSSGAECSNWITRYKNFWQARYSYFTLLAENFICQPSVFWRRQLFEAYGGFDEHENLAMDYEYWLRIGHSNMPISIPKVFAAFRRNKGTKSSLFYLQQFKDDFRIAAGYARRTRFYLPLALKCFHFCKTTMTYAVIYR